MLKLFYDNAVPTFDHSIGPSSPSLARTQRPDGLVHTYNNPPITANKSHVRSIDRSAGLEEGEEARNERPFLGLQEGQFHAVSRKCYDYDAMDILKALLTRPEGSLLNGQFCRMDFN